MPITKIYCIRAYFNNLRYVWVLKLRLKWDIIFHTYLPKIIKGLSNKDLSEKLNFSDMKALIRIRLVQALLFKIIYIQPMFFYEVL